MENGNGPIFTAENVNVAYISTNFGYKNSDGNGHIILEGLKTEIFNIIATDIGYHRSLEPPFYLPLHSGLISGKNLNVRSIM